MSFFSVSVHRNPGGYRWKKRGGLGPEDGDERYAKSLILTSVAGEESRDWERQFYEGAELPHRFLDDQFWYDPFASEPALFRIFATLEPSPEAILSFANNYGDISLNAPRLFDGMKGGFDGASLYGWRQAIDEIRELLQNADSLVTKKASKRNRQKNATEVAEFIDGVVFEIRVFLSTFIQNGAVGIRANSLSLFNAMKLQLVESLVEKKQYRECDLCGKPFELTPQVNRSDRIYCSDNCRVKAYQRRRKLANELRGQGRTLREIVNATGSDIQTIKQWLQSKGK